MNKKFFNHIFRLVKDDITNRNVDVIVNAANSYLKHGAGVAGVIVKNGGAIIQEERDKIDFVPVVSVAITTGGKLHCKSVIHAVGPRMGEGNEDHKLKNTIRNTLNLATEKNSKAFQFLLLVLEFLDFQKTYVPKY